MTYGFKFYNDNNNLVIDDTQVKPWYITDSQIGLNYSNVDVTSQFTQILQNQPRLDVGYGSPAETWDVYELKYYAPSGQACFVIYTLPEGSTNHIWYSTKTGPYSLTQGAGQGIAEYENGRPIFSIYAMVPRSWSATANSSDISAAIPKVYFYATGNPTAANSGYGIQVYDPNGQCTYSSAYQHIELESYSFKSPSLPIIDPNFVGPYLASAYVYETAINSPTPNNTGFLIPKTTFDRYQYNSSTNTAQLYGSRVFFQRQSNTLRARNIDTDYYGNLSASTFGIYQSTYLTKGLKVTSGSNTNYGLDTYSADILILDTGPLDRGYQSQPLPATYTLQLRNTDDIYEQEPSASTTPMYNQSIYLYVSGVTSGTIVPFTISGTNITTSDFSDMIDGYRGGSGQSFTPAFSGYITVYNGTAIFNFTVANDNILEGTETFTFTVYDSNNTQKASISVSIKEFKTYSLAWVSPNSSGAYNEGITAVARLTTRNVTNGTVIPFQIVAEPGNESVMIDADDIFGSQYGLTGNFTVNTSGTSTGTADLTMVITADQKTEGYEYFRITIPSVSTIYLSGRINDTSLAPVYTYSITRANQQTGDVYVDEGSSVTFYITSNAPDGTRVYPSLVNPATAGVADIVATDASGNNFFVNGVNSGVVINYGISSFTVTMTADNLFEGTEYFSVALDKPIGTRVADYNGKVYINDTSNGATYYLGNSTTETYSEGQWVDIAMYEMDSYGTNMFWTLEGTGIDTNDIQYMRYYNPNTQDIDFGLPAYQSITVSLQGTFTFPDSLEKHLQFFLKNDVATEGTETITFKLRTGGYTGATKASMSIVVTDTSQAPTITATITPNTTSINEGDSVTWTVNSTNVPNYTNLYWTMTGTVDSNDFSDSYTAYTYGTVQIVNNTGTFTRTLKQDYTTESQETIVMTINKDVSGNGSLLQALGTASTVYVTDSSVTPNESISISDSQPYTTTSSVTIYVSGAKPGDTIRWNVDNYDSSGTGTINSLGGFTYTTAPGNTTTHTFSCTFDFTGHSRSITWTPRAAAPTYSITANYTPAVSTTTSYARNEGETGYFYITSTNAANTTINYRFPFVNIGSPYDFISSDFTGSSISGGTVSLNSAGEGYITVNLTNNQRTETASPRYLFLQVYDNNVTSNYAFFLVYDTSQTPTVVTYNEQVTITPYQSYVGDGVVLAITGAKPGDTFTWSVDTETYHQPAITIDGTGGGGSGTWTNSNAGTDIGVGSHYFAAKFAYTGHTTKTYFNRVYPSAGTKLTEYCSGNTLIYTYANGSGGTYDVSQGQVVGKCGYTAPAGVTVSSYSLSATGVPNSTYYYATPSPNATYDGIRINAFNTYDFDYSVTRQFYVSAACTITCYLTVSTESNYDYGYIFVDDVAMYENWWPTVNYGTTAGNGEGSGGATGLVPAHGLSGSYSTNRIGESGYVSSGAMTRALSAGWHTVKVRYMADYSLNGTYGLVLGEYSIA